MEIINLQEHGKQLQLKELKQETTRAQENNNTLKYKVLTNAYNQIENKGGGGNVFKVL